MRFRCRDTVVTAVQWFATYGPCDGVRYDRHSKSYYLPTRKGREPVEDGDWLVFEDDGNCWVCKRSTFPLLYEQV